MKQPLLLSIMIASLSALNSQVSVASIGYTEFNIAVYKDKNCSPDSKLMPVIIIDTNQKCSNYSYTDSKGKVTKGSQTYIRCYKDKVVMDKFPFSFNCAKSSVISLKHTVTVGKCIANPSHEGTVYEKLEGYEYPGNENCQIESEQEYHPE